MPQLRDDSLVLTLHFGWRQWLWEVVKYFRPPWNLCYRTKWSLEESNKRLNRCSIGLQSSRAVLYIWKQMIRPLCCCSNVEIFLRLCNWFQRHFFGDSIAREELNFQGDRINTISWTLCRAFNSWTTVIFVSWRLYVHRCGDCGTPPECRHGGALMPFD